VRSSGGAEPFPIETPQKMMGSSGNQSDMGEIDSVKEVGGTKGTAEGQSAARSVEERNSRRDSKFEGYRKLGGGEYNPGPEEALSSVRGGGG